MLKFDKWFFPDGETHLPEWMRNTNKVVNGRLSYQYGKYALAMPYVKNKRVCIDIGSHVGLWAFHMAHDFENVMCFEPVEEHRQCWAKNMNGLSNVTLYPCALGAEEGMVSIECRTNGSSGDSQVSGDGGIKMYQLDIFEFDDVDFIKIDCEGYELEVLKGAIKTIERCSPVIIVEQKGNMIERYGSKKLGAVHFLEKIGYKIAQEVSGDYIMVK